MNNNINMFWYVMDGLGFIGGLAIIALFIYIGYRIYHPVKTSYYNADPQRFYDSRDLNRMFDQHDYNQPYFGDRKTYSPEYSNLPGNINHNNQF